MLGGRDLRALFRPPGGSPVTFAGVSAYTDDGMPICGLFERPSSFGLEQGGVGGVENIAPQLRLPFDAFSPMPQSGDTVTVADPDLGTFTFQVSPPTREEDGLVWMYELYAVTQ